MNKENELLKHFKKLEPNANNYLSLLNHYEIEVNKCSELINKSALQDRIIELMAEELRTIWAADFGYKNTKNRKEIENYYTQKAKENK